MRRIGRRSRGGTYFAERMLQRTLLVVLVAPTQEARDTVHDWVREVGIYICPLAVRAKQLVSSVRLEEGEGVSQAADARNARPGCVTMPGASMDSDGGW